MLEQWQIALLSLGAFVCVSIGYWLRYMEQKEYGRRDETEHQVGDPL